MFYSKEFSTCFIKAFSNVVLAFAEYLVKSFPKRNTVFPLSNRCGWARALVLTECTVSDQVRCARLFTITNEHMLWYILCGIYMEQKEVTRLPESSKCLYPKAALAFPSRAGGGCSIRFYLYRLGFMHVGVFLSR